jgi:hypothetical protein
LSFALGWNKEKMIDGCLGENARPLKYSIEDLSPGAADIRRRLLVIS